MEDTLARTTSELVLLQLENEFPRGKEALLEEQVTYFFFLRFSLFSPDFRVQKSSF